MLRTWLRFAEEFRYTTWIAHGSLLGWYWNGLAFPWEQDHDVQMPLSHLLRMAQRFNQSLVVGLDESYGSYFLDVGTFITERRLVTGRNNIDARFICTTTGLYIDITGLAATGALPDALYVRYLEAKLVEKGMRVTHSNRVVNDTLRLEAHTTMRVLHDRAGHCVLWEDLHPLQVTLMKGAVTFIPRNYNEVLANEYPRGMEESYFGNHVYVKDLRSWVPIQSIQGEPDSDELTDEAIIVLLSNAELYAEVYATHSLTRLRQLERQLSPHKRRLLIAANSHLPSCRPDLYVYRKSLKTTDVSMS